MNRLLRTPVAALVLAVASPATIVATALSTPTAVMAQRVSAAPVIGRLEIQSDAGLAPGAELNLRLEATPGSRATAVVRARKPITLQLREGPVGVYTNNFVIRRNDRIAEGDPIRVTVRRANRSSSADFEVPAGASRLGQADGRWRDQNRPFTIDRFGIGSFEQLEPGTELVFTLEGMPGARASLDISGVASNLPMREIRPGVYESRYTIRRQDRLSASTPVVATLRSGERVVSSNLVWPGAAADTRAPQITNVAPAEGARVAAGNISISGTLRDDRGGSGVDPRSVRIAVNGRDMTSLSQITPTSFVTPAVLAPGRHEVQVSARDAAGHQVRRDWTFEAGAAPVSPPLAIQLTGPTGMVVDGRTPIRVSGRTASGATVQATVTALVRGNAPIGTSQQVFAHTLQADPAGQFNFGFTPIAGPDVRYEVHLIATQSGQRDEHRAWIDQR